MLCILQVKFISGRRMQGVLSDIKNTIIVFYNCKVTLLALWRLEQNTPQKNTRKKVENQECQLYQNLRQCIIMIEHNVTHSLQIVQYHRTRQTMRRYMHWTLQGTHIGREMDTSEHLRSSGVTGVEHRRTPTICLLFQSIKDLELNMFTLGVVSVLDVPYLLQKMYPHRNETFRTCLWLFLRYRGNSIYRQTDGRTERRSWQTLTTSKDKGFCWFFSICHILIWSGMNF